MKLRPFALLASFAVIGCSAAPPDDLLPDGEDSEPHEEAVSGGVSFTQNSYGVTFKNADGEWVIYTDCFGPSKRNNQNLTVGPGYIARVTARAPLPSGSRVVLDAEAPLKDAAGNYLGLSSPGYSGLGQFGWHHARGSYPFQLEDNKAWEIAGRFCAADHGNFGVSSAKVIDGPRMDSSGDAWLSMDVFFTDAWTYPTPIMRLRYTYRVSASVIRMWASVTEHCNNGVCGNGAPGNAFIKEPKFVASVNAGAFRRIAVFNDKGEVATNSHSGNPTCLFDGSSNPQSSTNQCDADQRTRARFDWGTMGSDKDGGCDATTHLCLNAIMRAYPADSDGGVTPGQPGRFWEASGIGFDHWAELAVQRQAADINDSPHGNKNGKPWSCYYRPDEQRNRRWELVSWHRDAEGVLSAAQLGFHAWEGGTGAYDCEPLSRSFGPDGESFAVYGQFSLNAGWSID